VTMKRRQAAGLAEPPEGVLVGESLPRENEQDSKRRQAIEEMVGLLKDRGKPYTEMGHVELREEAKSKLRTAGVID